MKIEMWAVAKIKPYERNPRRNDDAVASVARSISEFGFRVPIVVDAEGVIIAGHTRLRAAESLGLAKVPVHVARELTPEQARALRIADNKLHELSTWDAELLPLELADLRDIDVDLSLLGFSADELEQLLPSGAADAADEVPEPLPEPVSRPGDLWLLGGHRLLCGDSTSGADVDRVLDRALADLVLTDPPYGVEYVGKTDQALVIENDGADGLGALLASSLGGALRASRPGAVWYVAAPAGPQFRDFADVLADLGVWRQTLVWVKDSMVLGRSDYHYKHEAIFYGWAPGAAHREPPDRTRTTVLEFERPKASREHPTMKPVALWSELMANSTTRGDLVYEPFSGSGTTIVTAEQLGRRCRAIELEPRYVDVAVRRWEQLTGKQAVLEGDGRSFADVSDERLPLREKAPEHSGAGKEGNDGPR
jgi:site-specific DNA-methyltransferase (adenine-specific)